MNRYEEFVLLRQQNKTVKEIAEKFKISRRRVRQILNKELSGRDRVREMVRKRDKYACQICFKKWEIGKRRFDIHHLNGICGKKSRGYDKIKEMNTLKTLCHKCHLGLKEVREKISMGHKKWVIVHR